MVAQRVTRCRQGSHLLVFCTLQELHLRGPVQTKPTHGSPSQVRCVRWARSAALQLADIFVLCPHLLPLPRPAAQLDLGPEVGGVDLLPQHSSTLRLISNVQWAAGHGKPHASVLASALQPVLCQRCRTSHTPQGCPKNSPTPGPAGVHHRQEVLAPAACPTHPPTHTLSVACAPRCSPLTTSTAPPG